MWLKYLSGLVPWWLLQPRNTEGDKRISWSPHGAQLGLGAVLQLQSHQPQTPEEHAKVLTEDGYALFSKRSDNKGKHVSLPAALFPSVNTSPESAVEAAAPLTTPADAQKQAQGQAGVSHSCNDRQPKKHLVHDMARGLPPLPPKKPSTQRKIEKALAPHPPSVLNGPGCAVSERVVRSQTESLESGNIKQSRQEFARSAASGLSPPGPSSKKQVEVAMGGIPSNVYRNPQVAVLGRRIEYRGRFIHRLEAEIARQAAAPNQAAVAAAAGGALQAAVPDISVEEWMKLLGEDSNPRKSSKSSKNRSEPGSSKTRQPLAGLDANAETGPTSSQNQGEYHKGQENQGNRDNDGTPGGSLGDLWRTFGQYYSAPQQVHQACRPLSALQRMRKLCVQAWQANHGELFLAARLFIESSIKNFDPEHVKYMIFHRTADKLERWKLDLHTENGVRAYGPTMCVAQSREATRIWLLIHYTLSAPVMPEDERYAVITGIGHASNGAQFNAVADELVALQNNHIVKKFGALSNNSGFWVTLTRPTLPRSAHIAQFADKARATA